MKVISRWCSNCGSMRAFERSTPNWLLHVVLCVLTAGLWLIPLSISMVFGVFRPFRCRSCGKAKW